MDYGCFDPDYRNGTLAGHYAGMKKSPAKNKSRQGYKI